MSNRKKIGVQAALLKFAAPDRRADYVRVPPFGCRKDPSEHCSKRMTARLHSNWFHRDSWRPNR